MHFQLNINMDNAAFEEQPLNEVARILEEEAKKLRYFGDQHTWENKLRDVNGNTVGRAFVGPNHA